MSQIGLFTDLLNNFEQLESGHESNVEDLMVPNNPDWNTAISGMDIQVVLVTDNFPGQMIHTSSHVYQVTERIHETDNFFLVEVMLRGILLDKDEQSKQWLICGFKGSWDDIKPLVSNIIIRSDGKSVIWRSMNVEEIQNDCVRKINPPELKYRITRYQSDRIIIMDQKTIDLYERLKHGFIDEEDLLSQDTDTLELLRKRLYRENVRKAQELGLV